MAAQSRRTAARRDLDGRRGIQLLSPFDPGPALVRLALALAVGLFVGVEREHRRKEAGLRTFAFASLLCGAGALAGQPYALMALALVGVLVVLLNLESIRAHEDAEMTTSAALIVTAFAGLLAGLGHTVTPAAMSVATAALLAWKEPLSGFSRTLTESELRSAIMLAILALVVYPVLPSGSVDPWHLIQPRAAWATVILIAALGFANYILLKVYGTRGVELTGFLGGLVNSTVTVTELAGRARDSSDRRFAGIAYRGVVLATAAMLVRNALILGVLAIDALRDAAIPLILMLTGTLTASILARRAQRSSFDGDAASLPALRSPFSLTSALQFGAVFVALEVAGTLAQRGLGHGGFYGVSVIGGAVSSASAVASAATLASAGRLAPRAAAIGAVLATLVSVAISLPLVARVGKDRALTKRVGRVIGGVILLGLLGLVLQISLPDLLR